MYDFSPLNPMTRRVAPSPEGIAETLRREPSGDGDLPALLPYAQAVIAVRTACRTTHKNATGWLDAAVRAGTVEQVMVSRRGMPSVLRLKSPDSTTRWHVTLHHAGYGTRDSDWHVHADSEGRFSRDPVGESATATTWITLPETLRLWAQAGVEAGQDRAVTREAGAILTQASFEYLHGDAGDLFRGLLAMAGLASLPTREDIRSGFGVVDQTVTDKASSLTVRLTGDAIDAVADVLRAAGVSAVTADEWNL